MLLAGSRGGEEVALKAIPWPRALLKKILVPGCSLACVVQPAEHKDSGQSAPRLNVFLGATLASALICCLSGGNQHFETLPSFSSRWHPREKRKGRKQQTRLIST